MEYTEEQIRQFKEEFAKRKKNRIIMTVAVLVAVALIMFFGRSLSLVLVGSSALFLGAMFVLVLAAIVFYFKNDRCPACNGLLSKSSWAARFCPLCGVPLS
jgi:Mn2+/Fe2+ NRAMP family transporter